MQMQVCNFRAEELISQYFLFFLLFAPSHAAIAPRCGARPVPRMSVCMRCEAGTGFYLLLAMRVRTLIVCAPGTRHDSHHRGSHVLSWMSSNEIFLDQLLTPFTLLMNVIVLC